MVRCKFVLLTNPLIFVALRVTAMVMVEVTVVGMEEDPTVMVVGVGEDTMTGWVI